MRTASIVSTVLAVSFAGVANANLLVNAGFEANVLTSAANVLTNFTGFQGIWGPENAAITGVNGGVTPFAGNRMLKMDDDGLSYTQAFQATDVSANAVNIDAGLMVGGLAARFTTGPFLTGAIAGVRIHFFSASNWASQIGVGYGSATALDGSAATWQVISAGGSVPVGTRWIVSEVLYKDSTLYSSNGVAYSGYVDNADMDIRLVPAPGAAAFLAIAGIVGSRRRRVG